LKSSLLFFGNREDFVRFKLVPYIIILIYNLVSLAQIETAGCFLIQGFSSQQLKFVSSQGVLPISSLGAVANVLRIFEDELYIVHSGDWAAGGTGAEVWRSSFSEINTALAESRDPDWLITTLADGSNPWDVLRVAETIWVSQTNTNSISILDLESGSVLHTISGLNAPQGLALSAQTVAVAQSGWGYGNQLSLFDAQSFEHVSTIELADNPQYIVTDLDGNFHVLCSGRSWGDDSVAGELFRVNPVGIIEESVVLNGNPGEIQISIAAELEPARILLSNEWATTEPHVLSYPADDYSSSLEPAVSSGGLSLCRSLNGNYIGDSAGNLIHYDFAWQNPETQAELADSIVDLVFYHAWQTISDLDIIVTGGSVDLSWTALSGNPNYVIYSSIDPHQGFEADLSGEFSGATWSTAFDSPTMYYRVGVE
jgi:hypothetical protein